MEVTALLARAEIADKNCRLWRAYDFPKCKTSLGKEVSGSDDLKRAA
jgi:hypothetical protein